MVCIEVDPYNLMKITIALGGLALFVTGYIFRWIIFEDNSKKIGNEKNER